MKILVTGRGTSGSWQIRGEQLGRAIGATVQPNAARLAGFDLGIIVKRAPSDLLYRAHSVKLPLVYDVLDGWPQPVGNHEWRRDDCLYWLRRQINTIKPVGIVAATRTMAEDCKEFGLPVLSLPHHARPGQRINPLRERIQTVGYEGAEQYLGRWREVLEREAQRRGWQFMINGRYDLFDLVVAVRDANGYAARHWKSNVKLANAQASGTPCIVGEEAGYEETGGTGEIRVSKPDDVATAYEALTPLEARSEAASRLRAGTISLEQVAKDYQEWLSRLKF